jgi:hypothetical protein
MSETSSGSFETDGVAALALLQEALALLDRMHAPEEIGAQVDHSIQRLRAILPASPSEDESST